MFHWISKLKFWVGKTGNSLQATALTTTVLARDFLLRWKMSFVWTDLAGDFLFHLRMTPWSHGLKSQPMAGHLRLLLQL